MRFLATGWFLVISSAVAAQGPDGDWRYFGGDAGGQKYSKLDQIHRGNVSELEVAWIWKTGEKPLQGPRLPVPGNRVQPGSFEATPLVIDGVMYLTTSYNRVIALDPDTGKEIWVFDPRIVEWGQVPNGMGFVHRGVATWLDGEERRLFLNSRWRLIQIDARTGEPVPSFGHRGEIDLTERLLWPTHRLHYTQTSAPVIYKNLVILGNGVWDGFVYEQDPPGNVQAFDARTGELVWNFNLIPQKGEYGNETWEDDSWRTTGHTNVWAPFTLDEERGLIYLPVGTPSNDYYGGHRKGDNLFAESIVCLNAETGERVWHFQAVRHGLWDYDLGSPPTLLTIEVEGKKIDAVAVPTKMGFVFVFDRVTGKPVWPIEDRAVPPSEVPGERAAETQPFPTRPAPVSEQGFDEDDVIAFTPELKEAALAVLKKYRHGPLYTPPSMEGTITMPGIIGGANWGGAAADPETGWIYVKASNLPALLAMDNAEADKTEGDYSIDRTRRALSLANGLPINKPPYGVLTAIDLNRGEHVFQVPVGDDPLVRDHPALKDVPLPKRLGATGATGPIVTKGGLVFVSGGASELYAFDKTTGKELWFGALGAKSNANPMTYLGKSGRQYVVVATGLGEGNQLVAFSLPR
ncbi:MAG: pyrroloquinoline quinone-dependent dehydrogenase [Vicinamibacteria bacterium]